MLLPERVEVPTGRGEVWSVASSDGVQVQPMLTGFEAAHLDRQVHAGAGRGHGRLANALTGRILELSCPRSWRLGPHRASQSDCQSDRGRDSYGLQPIILPLPR